MYTLVAFSPAGALASVNATVEPLPVKFAMIAVALKLLPTLS